MSKIQKSKEEIERLKNEQLSIFSEGENDEICSTALTCIGVYNQLLSFINSLPEESTSEDTCLLGHDYKNRDCENCSFELCKRFSKPASEDLDEEIDRCWEGWIDPNPEVKGVDGYLSKNEFSAYAHHFAEWQREKGIKLDKMEDLEEFAQKWAYSNYHKELDEVNCDCLYRGVKKGAEWQKQKDLEDLFKSDMTMPNKFYEKGKADAMKEMKEALQTEYEKGRFDMREEMMKDAVDATIINDWQYGKDPDHAVIPAIHQRIEGFNVGDKVKIIIIKEEQK